MNEITELVKVTKTKSILYVEDDKDIRFNVSELLKNLFATVISAVDRQDGLNKLKKSEVKLLVEDAISNKITDIDGLYNITINRFVSDCASGFLKTDLSLSEDSVYPSYEYYNDISPTESGLNNIFDRNRISNP